MITYKHEPRQAGKATRRKFLLTLRYLALAFFVLWFLLFMADSAYPDTPAQESQAAYNLACVRALVKDSYDYFATDAGCQEAERIVEFITSSSYIDSEGNLWQYQWTLLSPALAQEATGEAGGSTRGDNQ